ncbi:MAG: hypothetical protein U1E53_34225 [Dongiaceae bacterium]
MDGKASLTAAELAVLISIWPGGTHHPGAAADVFSACGRAGRWVLVAKRADGGYVLVEDGGRHSRCGGSLAALGLPDRPIRTPRSRPQ